MAKESKKTSILVATSGDTGSAVAQGFYGVENIDVVILFPKNKVSPIQEKQMTTLGGNISALCIDGTFDDCQDFVKRAFLDKDILAKRNLSSANSINIARLIPQSFYYIWSALQLQHHKTPLVYSVPSGNFGNLCAGLMAKKMGAPIAHFIAATNINDEVPQYLKTGIFQARPSISTLSNAMDVGNPSNFDRISFLHQHNLESIRASITGFTFSDEETRLAMKHCYERQHYTLDPHGAVAYAAAQAYEQQETQASIKVVLETAHPAKFGATVEDAIHHAVEIPESLLKNLNAESRYLEMPNDYEAFKASLLEF